MTASMTRRRLSPEEVRRASLLEIQILDLIRDVEQLASGAYRRSSRISEACHDARRLIDDADVTTYFSEMTKEQAFLDVEAQRRFSETVGELRSWIEQTKQERAAHRLHPLDR